MLKRTKDLNIALLYNAPIGVEPNMNTKALVIIAMMLLCLSLVQAVPATIDNVKVDGDTLIEGDVNKLSLERGQEFEVRVRVTSTSPIANAEVVAFVSGFDFSRDEDRISDSSGVFDMSSNNTVIKKLTLTLPDRADQDDYRLRVIFSDRDGQEVVSNYRISIEAPRHSVVIRDVLLNPSGSVEAGRSLLASVRLKNMGDKDEGDIKVSVNIPDLGLSASDFVREIQSDESGTSEELFFRIPVCAKPGVYPVNVEMEYDDGFRSANKETMIEVTESPLCEKKGGSGSQPAQTNPTMSVSPESVKIAQGEGGNYFTVTVSNPTSASKNVFLSVDGQNNLQTKFSPSNVLMMSAGDTQNVFVYVTATDKTPKGAQILTVSAKDASGKILRSQAVKVEVEKAESTDPSFEFGGDMVQ